MYAARLMGMDELLEALYVEEGLTEIDCKRMFVPAEIIEMCYSLVVHEESK